MRSYVNELWLYAYLFFAFRLFLIVLHLFEEGYTIDAKHYVADIVTSPFTLAVMLHTLYKSFQPHAKWVLHENKADSAA